MNSEYSYEDMIEKIGEDRLHEKYTEVLASANHFIEEAGYESHVECNERILFSLILDYYADLFRLKDFHGIEWIRTEKSFAYLIAWIVRRKPLQFVHYTEDEKDIYINERFATFLMLNECLLCGEKRFVGRENQSRLDEYHQFTVLLFQISGMQPQVIELALNHSKWNPGVLENEKAVAQYTVAVFFII